MRDLAALAHLSSLRKLYLSETPVADLAALARSSVLQVLDVSRTLVTDLGPLISLVRRGCAVKQSSDSWRGDGIYVGECPLAYPPAGIIDRGNAAILDYLEARSRGGVDHLYEAKMLIVGEGGAGKTSLLRRLFLPGKGLPTEEGSTKGIGIHKHEFKLKNGRTFRLNVWDFGGQQIYHATHQFLPTKSTRARFSRIKSTGRIRCLQLI